jgi:hypothetical protein
VLWSQPAQGNKKNEDKELKNEHKIAVVERK